MAHAMRQRESFPRVGGVDAPGRGASSVRAARVRRPILTCALGVLAIAAGCQDKLRIGEYVWVEWCGTRHPAYILGVKDRARFRVHYEGVPERFDEDVPQDRILGRIKGEVPPVMPPDCVTRALGVSPKASASARAPSEYKPGDRIKVRWRESVYNAKVLEVLGPNRFRVHYEGHEAAWDEVIPRDRIVTKWR